jgi:hypothetical protein
LRHSIRQHWRVTGAGTESDGQAKRLSVLERQNGDLVIASPDARNLS